MTAAIVRLGMTLALLAVIYGLLHVLVVAEYGMSPVEWLDVNIVEPFRLLGRVAGS